ncbi:hypothetical protein D3C86_1361250 [compost metagenome]
MSRPFAGVVTDKVVMIRTFLTGIAVRYICISPYKVYFVSVAMYRQIGRIVALVCCFVECFQII